MRICIVCSRLCYGGAERVAVLLANGFFRKGYEVMVVSNLNEPITYVIEDGIHIKSLVVGSTNKIVKWASAFFKTRRCLTEFRPDIVIGIMGLCSIIAKISSCGLAIPVIMTEHNAFERSPFGKMSYLERVSKFYINKIYSYVTVLTKADKRIIDNRLKRVYVMPNPLALPPVDDVPLKENVFLAVGRLDGWRVKGFDILIKAWGSLMKGENIALSSSSNRDGVLKGWRLQIAGTGSEESLEYLKRLCMENRVEDSVEFLGFVSDMQSLYQKASVFVLSSRYEGFGLVLIEAMSQGCACIACDYKGRQSEIIENCSQGMICPPGDVDALSQCMNRLLNDVGYRESIRVNAIERSKYYTIDRVIMKWEELLQKTVKQ